MISPRQICRAKVKEPACNGMWAIGFYYFMRPNRHFILVSCDDFAIIKYEIDPKTLGMCTGMTDIKGHMIFEGDCLGHRDNVVEICNGSFCTNGDRDLYLQAKELEVLGNIYDGTEHAVQDLQDLLVMPQLVDIGAMAYEDGEEKTARFTDEEVVNLLLGMK